MTTADRVRAEFERRRAINPSFSLRAFARRLGISHSALSRVCRGRSHASAATLAKLESRLGAHAVSAAESERSQRLARLAALLARPGFTADARWLAVRLGLSLDDVQVAIQDALRAGQMTMVAPGTWIPRGAEER